MTRLIGAATVSATLTLCAAAPAFSQAFETKHEIDFDVAVALADREGVRGGVHGDFRLRWEAEAVTDAGLRWGGAVDFAARTRDGRRGLQTRGDTGGRPGLVTGLGGPGLSSQAAAGLTRGELFVKSGLLEVHAGHGPTAARRERIAPPGALRLTSVDGALIDPLGAGLIDTGLTLSAPAPQVTVRSRRLAGFALAASYTPDGDACGPDRCLNAAYGRVEEIVSAAVSFDRRDPRTRARWRATAGLETGAARPGSAPLVLEDPRVFTVQAARELDGVTVQLNGIHAEEGLEGLQYAAWSARITLESGDWLVDAALGRARSDAADRQGWTAQVGASRFVGRRGLAGLAVQLQDKGGAALIAETGLRF